MTEWQALRLFAEHLRTHPESCIASRRRLRRALIGLWMTVQDELKHSWIGRMLRA